MFISIVMTVLFPGGRDIMLACVCSNNCVERERGGGACCVYSHNNTVVFCVIEYSRYMPER